MDKYICDKSNGLWHKLEEDYYISCLSLPKENQKPVGVWGQRHLRYYIRQRKRILYTSLLTNGKLNS